MNDESIVSRLEELSSRFEAIELNLEKLLSRFDGAHDKEWYTVTEAAEAMGRAPYTVREWCRLGRLHASKALSGRGIDGEWRIGRDELQRWRREGLLPTPHPYRHIS